MFSFFGINPVADTTIIMVIVICYQDS